MNKHRFFRTLVLIILFAPIAVLMLTFNARPAVAPAPTPIQQEFILNTTDPATEEVTVEEIDTTIPKEEPKDQTPTAIPIPIFVDITYYENFLAALKPNQATELIKRLSNLKLGPYCPTAGKDYQPASEIDINNSIGNYLPVNLVELSGQVPLKYSSLCLDALAFIHYQDMVMAAQADNVSIVATSGYRDRATQKYLYKNSPARSLDPNLLSVAKPGHSEHQLGTTLDLTTPEINNKSAIEEFETTAAFAWLQANAEDYGFYLSYPKENTSGYIYEPWHWRWLGKIEQ